MKVVMSFLLLAIACCSCASLGAAVQEQSAPSVSLLIVENQRTVDEWIYLERDGAKGRKLGHVTALSIDTLVLRAVDGPPGARVAFDAIAFASGNADQSDPVVIERGIVYRWQLAPMRGSNFISQRSTE